MLRVVCHSAMDILTDSRCLESVFSAFLQAEANEELHTSLRSMKVLA